MNTDFISDTLFDYKQAALITSPINRRYLTGMSSSFGVVVVTKDRKYFLTDLRYYEKAVRVLHNTPFKVVLIDTKKEQTLQQQLGNIFYKHEIESLTVENHSMTLAGLTRYKEMFPLIEFDTSPHLSDLIAKKRMVKTKDEISKIEAAQRIAERAFAKLLNKIRPGMTEKQIAAVLNYYMMELGAEKPAFDTIVASGRNSSIPHWSPSEKPIEKGDFIVLDFGAVIDGYNSDMTRTVVIDHPTDSMKRVYDAVLSANTDALRAIRSDITGKVIDNTARATLEAWGYDTYFGHGLGHGVGLEVHENPTLSLNAKSNSSLCENMVVTIEPGVYIPGKFGVRIEDMVVITKNGHLNLTKTPKTLIRI